MKSKIFTIPKDSMVEFSDKLTDLELTNEITGITEDEEITIEVSYEPDEKQNVFDLMEWVEDNVEVEED
jgi:hypothetical protein